jgi:hypothetical protein
MLGIRSDTDCYDNKLHPVELGDDNRNIHAPNEVALSTQAIVLSSGPLLVS